MRRLLLGGACLQLALSLAVVGGGSVAAAPDADEAPVTPPVVSAGPVAFPARADVLVHRVHDGERTLTLRLTPVTIASPAFEVLVQKADGQLVEKSVRPRKAYVGTVDRRPGVVAVAHLGRDGIVRGQIVADRGATTWFTGDAVTGTRGTTPPTSYKWPSSATAARNQTVDPGMAGDQTYRWTVAYDVDDSTFVDTYGGRVGRAVDAIELMTVQMLATYERDARLRPTIGRIVLRRSDTVGPYVGMTSNGDLLGAVKNHWNASHADTPWDNVALLHDETSGGLAYVGTLGGDWSASANGGGAEVVIVRHEIGHNWGTYDNHTNGPEGATVESGNQFARFDGTEVRAILLQRDDALLNGSRKLTRVAPMTAPIPPYAALDLIDDLQSGDFVDTRPAKNDHDANGQRVRLLSADATSHLGGQITVDGSLVSYTAPDVGGADTIDWFFYKVGDGSGRTATGVVVLRVDP